MFHCKQANLKCDFYGYTCCQNNYDFLGILHSYPLTKRPIIDINVISMKFEKKNT